MIPVEFRFYMQIYSNYTGLTAANTINISPNSQAMGL